MPASEAASPERPYTPLSSRWQPTSDLPLPVESHSAVQLATGKVLIAGGDVFGAGLWAEYDPQTGRFASGSLLRLRSRPSVTLLKDGRVLVAGGRDGDEADASAEVFDPSTGEWSATGSMNEARWKHTATLLTSGEVLVVGGAGTGSVLRSAELYDPTSGSFAVREELDTPRADHTATRLPSGDVLVTGGLHESAHSLVYRTSSRTFEPAAPMSRPRKNHSATLLLDGRVLVAGGKAGLDEADGAEVYDPSMDTFTLAGKMSVRRSSHRATGLPSGRVLITGGESGGVPVASVELFDPFTSKFEAAESLTTARASHAALLLQTGKVLVTGGRTLEGVSFTAEQFDPDVFEGFSLGAMFTPRLAPAAALLPSGEVLVAAGSEQVSAELCHATRGCRTVDPPSHDLVFPEVVSLPSGDVVIVGGQSAADNSVSRAVEVYRVETGTFESPAELPVPLTGHATSLLPGEKVLIAGGHDGVSVQSSAYVFDPAEGTIESTGPMLSPRFACTATRLDGGRVVFAGGLDDGLGVMVSVEVYDPESEGFESGGGLATPRCYHSATPVEGGVLFVGGFDESGPLSTIERYDAAAKTSKVLGSLKHGRGHHTATPLPSGKVLVAGGSKVRDFETLADYANWVSEAELVDPDTGASELVGSFRWPRLFHRAVALTDGRVMVLGGRTDAWWWRPLEIFDFASRTFTSPVDYLAEIPVEPSVQLLPDGDILVAGGVPPTTEARVVNPREHSSVVCGSLSQPGGRQKTTLLDDSHVLLAGGTRDNVAVATADLYDIAQRTFSPVGSMASARRGHALTRLPSGAVLVTGGIDDGYRTLASAELYDPASRQFATVGDMLHPRHGHATVLLPSGQVLVVGGLDGATAVTATEVFDPSTGAFQPFEVATPGGSVLAVPLPTGDPLVAGNATAFRLDLDSSSLHFFADTPVHPVALLPRIGGEVLVCGGDRCARLDASVSWPSVPTPMLSFASWLVDLPSTDLFVAGGSVGVEGQPGEPSAFQLRRSDGARLPVVQDVTVEDAETPRITIHGARFATSPASDSVAIDAPPAVVFRSSGHGTVSFPVHSWADGLISASSPATVYHGPGWLHVIVEGVPSEGRFLVLPPASSGTRCEVADQCASGYCVEGVCCDDACEGPCVTCLAAYQAEGRDGVCGFVAQGEDPRVGCEGASADTCWQDGTCDGQGACALYADGTQCRKDGRCESGTCLRCNDARDAVLAGDSIVSCAPFACRDGGCLSSCRSQLDCAPTYRCGADGRCLALRPAVAQTDPGSCSVGSAPRPGLSGWWGVCLALALVRRRLGLVL